MVCERRTRKKKWEKQTMFGNYSANARRNRGGGGDIVISQAARVTGFEYTAFRILIRGDVK